MKTTVKTELGESALNLPANQEDLVFYDEVFQIQWRNHQIWVNDTYYISKPVFDYSYEQFFNYVYQHPGQRVTREELEQAIKSTFNQSFSKVVNYLGFSGPLKEAYFPGVSRKAVVFRNSVTIKDLDELNIEFGLFKKALEKRHRAMTG